MKPEQIQTAVNELLTLIHSTKRPANEVINTYTRTRRYIGSKDRHQLTNLVWQSIKNTPTPKWITNYVPAEELEAMKNQAATILRVNDDRMKIQKSLKDKGIDSIITPLSPLGLILKKRVDLNVLSEYKAGLIEVQDEGSQLVSLATKIKAGDTVLDYCAGAGGKSLCLAQIMKNTGKIVAHDISSISLKKLQERAKRAHASIIFTTLKPTGIFDHVIVDAPCSGSGTWRRNPDGRLKLTQTQLHNLINKQASILEKALPFVRLNGYLHFITCSVIDQENLTQVRFFLKKHKELKLIHHQQWTPAKTNTDGFFLATLQKIK